jgi:hypothetical protein
LLRRLLHKTAYLSHHTIHVGQFKVCGAWGCSPEPYHMFQGLFSHTADIYNACCGHIGPFFFCASAPLTCHLSLHGRHLIFLKSEVSKPSLQVMPVTCPQALRTAHSNWSSLEPLLGFPQGVYHRQQRIVGSVTS